MALRNPSLAFEHADHRTAVLIADARKSGTLRHLQMRHLADATLQRICESAPFLRHLAGFPGDHWYEGEFSGVAFASTGSIFARSGSCLAIASWKAGRAASLDG